jgi:Holliday junction DNA helicase RuvA
MIGLLRGRLLSKAPPQLLVDVSGIGYELEAPMSTFYGLPALGAEVQLLTHLVVREDAHILYGFATDEERRLFRGLLKVSGVGPKIALAILSGVSVEAFAQIVTAQDASALTRVPGVGRKTAERLLIEMRDRIDAIAQGSGASAALLAGGASSASGEAFSALVALGYKPTEATRLLKAAAPAEAANKLSTEELIRRALQGAARED